MRKNAIIGQSGGPTSAINATLAGVIKGLSGSKGGKIYGAVYGIEGIVNENIIDINSIITDELSVKKLIQTPSSFLKCCRFKMPSAEDDRALYIKIFDIFRKYDIGYFFYIGGNDSMDTVDKLSRFAEEINFDIKIVGVPKTVDNDLAVTDHTPGFGSAAKYIATSIKELTRDVNSFNVPYVLIVEIMGRNAGWLAASAALAKSDDCEGADLIYFPEVEFSKKRFLEDVTNLLKTKNTVIAVISEGIKNKYGKYLFEDTTSVVVDNFGHKYMGGAASVLSQYVKDAIGCKTRAVEINLLQRCAGHLLSKSDIEESLMIGNKAAEFALDGKTGVMMIFKRRNQHGYHIEVDCCDISQAANVEKMIPRNWINEEGNNITQEMLEYLKPLIDGEYEIFFENGLPAHMRI